MNTITALDLPIKLFSLLYTILWCMWRHRRVHAPDTSHWTVVVICRGEDNICCVSDLQIQCYNYIVTEYIFSAFVTEFLCTFMPFACNCFVFIYRQVASVSDGNLTGRQGQLLAAMTQDSKTDYTKEAKLLLRAVEVFVSPTPLWKLQTLSRSIWFIHPSLNW